MSALFIAMKLKDLLPYIDGSSHIRVVTRDYQVVYDGAMMFAYNDIDVKYYNSPIRAIFSGQYIDAIIIELK